MDEPLYNTGAVGYDACLGQVTRMYLPVLMRAARLRTGQRVLDVATGTGAAAEAAATIVGMSGSVVGGDASPNMLAIACNNLRGLPITLVQLDAHSLPFPAGCFDAVVCQLGLMFFADPARALKEVWRVLRPNGYAAVSINSTPERTLFLRVGVTIGQYVPAKAELFRRPFSISDAGRLHALFHEAGFGSISLESEVRRIPFGSFDDYFRGIEAGATLSGQEYVGLPEDIRRLVRDTVHRDLPHSLAGGPFEIEMELLIGSGCR